MPVPRAAPAAAPGRAPWHVLDSFEESVLADHFAEFGSALDPAADLDVVLTLGIGIAVPRQALLGLGEPR